jgi:hypothetical protein
VWGQHETKDFGGRSTRYWFVYICSTCGGAILTESPEAGYGEVNRLWPEADNLSDAIPERARIFLKQAMESLHAPSLAQIGAASAVDAMLKDKGLKTGSLYNRIDEATASGLITPEMAPWAHEVRLDANDQRHADDNAPLPTKEEAEKTIEFAKALAQFLYVLPAMVTRGRAMPGLAQAAAPPAPAIVQTQVKP